MDAIFMNSENSRTPEPHMLKLKLTDKLDLRLDKKVIVLSNLSIFTYGIVSKVHTIIINLKSQHQQYQIFKIIFNIF